MEEFDILDAFNFVDGRLANSMDRVRILCERYSNNDFLTDSALIATANKIKKDNPEWYIKAEEIINFEKESVGDDFNTLMNRLKEYDFKFKI